MKQDLIIYHGSQQIVEIPKYGIGKQYNDYRQGFYCTENIELAKEWACPVKNDGYANKYRLILDGMNVMHLTNGKFNILNWLAILLAHRKFDINLPVGNNARDFILNRFMPDVTNVDVMVGYRADDSYFSFAEDFVNNTISLRDLSLAMQLGTSENRLFYSLNVPSGKFNLLNTKLLIIGNIITNLSSSKFSSGVICFVSVRFQMSSRLSLCNTSSILQILSDIIL